MALFTKRYFLQLSKEQYDAVDRWAKDFEKNKKRYDAIFEDYKKMRTELADLRKEVAEVHKTRQFKPNR